MEGKKLRQEAHDHRKDHGRKHPQEKLRDFVVGTVGIRTVRIGIVEQRRKQRGKHGCGRNDTEQPSNSVGNAPNDQGGQQGAPILIGQAVFRPLFELSTGPHKDTSNELDYSAGRGVFLALRFIKRTGYASLDFSGMPSSETAVSSAQEAAAGSTDSPSQSGSSIPAWRKRS